MSESVRSVLCLLFDVPSSHELHTVVAVECSPN